MDESFGQWLGEHFKGAKAHYAKLCRLDDREVKKGGSSEYYEQAHQMFGYVAALEACVNQFKRREAAAPVKKAAKARRGR